MAIISVILMALFPVLFFLVLDVIFKGTYWDHHTIDTLQAVAHAPLQVILAIVMLLVGVVVAAALLAALDKLRRKAE